jgi:hypothetical protein
MSRAATATLLALALALPAPSAARAPRATAAEHVAAANRAFQAKSYELALAELRIAYQLAPRPEFLLTFAQIYRAAGRLQQALEACDSYLATVPNGPMAQSARKLSETLKTELARATPPPSSPPPPPSGTPAPNPTNPANPTNSPSAPPAAVVALAPPTPATPEVSHRRRLALGLALGLAAPPSSPSPSGSASGSPSARAARPTARSSLRPCPEPRTAGERSARAAPAPSG